MPGPADTPVPRVPPAAAGAGSGAADWSGGQARKECKIGDPSTFGAATTVCETNGNKQRQR